MSETLDFTNILKKDALFLWLDILGFSDEIINGNKEKNKIILDGFKKMFTSEKLNIFPHNIGDALIFYKEIEVESEFWAFIQFVALKQFEFVLKYERQLRGAIVFDRKIDNSTVNLESLVISPGMSLAVKHECKKVEWPAIGLGVDKSYENLPNYFNRTKLLDDRLVLKTYTRNGSEVLFLDFLGFATGNEIKKINQIIDKQIFEQTNEDVKEENRAYLQKYLWFKRYIAWKMKLYQKHPLFEGYEKVIL